MSAIKHLVSEIVDYAGLFPPAKLPLHEVVANYEEYLSGEFAWMLARLVLPVGKLVELEQLPTFIQSKHRWRISGLVPSVSEAVFEEAIASIHSFNTRHQSTNKSIVDNIEIKAPTVELVEQTAKSIPSELAAFLELPHCSAPIEHVAAIAAADQPNLFAKIRTGGVAADLIPASNQVADFIVTCAQQDVGMKATAGLHHPIRGSYRLTYENDPEFGTMYGYLNVFLAGCFAFAGNHDAKFIEQILTESNAESFEFKTDGISYLGQNVSTEQVNKIRSSKLWTFGSCSFTEPTGELQHLGLIHEQINS